LVVTIAETSTRERIVCVALQEIEKNGIVGLRVADVAAGADVSVPLIYKYFRDRDGLLAEVLSETLTNVFLNDTNRIRSAIESRGGKISAEELADMMPMPNDPVRKRNRRLRAMATAASYDIPKLADALAVNQRLINAATLEVITLVRECNGSRSQFSPAAVMVVLQALGFGMIVADYTSDSPVKDSEYRALLVDLFNRLVIE
jgi:AcrR family transcriptional regulator